MPPKRIKWSRERVEGIARKCENFTEFRKRYPSAYNYALRHGFQRKITFNAVETKDGVTLRKVPWGDGYLTAIDFDF